MRISLAIPHADWDMHRRYHLGRLRDRLADDAGLERADDIPYHEVRGKMPFWAWSHLMWKWSVEQDVTHCLFLTDDVDVAPRFWDILAAMLAVHPDKPIGFMSPLRAGVRIAKEGGRWYTIGAGLTGPGYILPKPLLAEFLTWRDKQEWHMVTTWGEDSLLNEFLSRTKRVSYHPVPSIVDHNPALASCFSDRPTGTYGSRPTVLWDGRTPFQQGPGLPAYDIAAMCDPAFWRTEAIAESWD